MNLLKKANVNTDSVIGATLIILVIISWTTFPFMLKPLNVSIANICLLIVMPLLIIAIVTKAKINPIKLTSLQKMMLACWIGYLMFLLFATVNSSSIYSLVQWGILFGKFLFFLFLFYFIDERLILKLLNAYANFVVLVVLFAIITVGWVLLGLPKVSTINLGGREVDLFWGAYYVQNTAICEPISIYRIQGLSEEPATFAFTLLPAFFWFLIVKKAYVRCSIIILGLTLSMSFGVGLLILILLPIIFWKFGAERKILAFYVLAGFCLFSSYGLSRYCSDNYFNKLDDITLIKGVLGENLTDDYIAEYNLKSDFEKIEIRKETIEKIKSSLSTLSQAKPESFKDRISGLKSVFDYLITNAAGTGAALGMLTLNHSISVGYAVALVESGILGGVLYISLFAIMSWSALNEIFISKSKSLNEQMRIVVALSIICVLVMGAQRIQPDLSFWHMWIYGMWFFLIKKSECNFRSTGL